MVEETVGDTLMDKMTPERRRDFQRFMLLPFVLFLLLFAWSLT